MKLMMLCLFTAISLSSQAQKHKTMQKTQSYTPMLMRGIGVSFQKFDGLNSRVQNLPQFKELPDYAGTLNLGWMNVKKQWISDMDISLGSSMTGDREKRSSTIRYAGIGIDLGYDVIPADMIMLYPFAGIGAQGYQARFYKDNSSVSFTDVLTSSTQQNNIRPVAFTNLFGTYRLGLGFAVKCPKHPTSTMGLRVSYTGSFKDKTWKSSDNQTLAGAPEDGISQFNVSLVMTNVVKFMKW